MKRKKLTRKEKIRISQLNKKSEQAKSYKKTGIGLIITGTAFIFFFGYMWINRNYEIKREDLITIEGFVVNELELKWKRRAGYSMIIRLDNYPEIDFKTGRFGTRALKTNLLQSNVKIGDRIQVDLMKNDFDKIILSKPKNISAYGIRDDKNEYLNVNGYNKEFKKDRNSIAIYLLLGFSFWMFGYGIYLWIKYRKPAANRVPDLDQ